MTAASCWMVGNGAEFCAKLERFSSRAILAGFAVILTNSPSVSWCIESNRNAISPRPHGSPKHLHRKAPANTSGAARQIPCELETVFSL